MTDRPMLKAALEYAALGWPVFPVRHDKTPYTRNGVLDASTDAAQVGRWWSDWPGANIALSAGEAGLLVLDYDPGSDPRAAEAAVIDLPATRLVARTPRGGEHHYYRLDPQDPPVPSRVQPFAEHVDTRSFRGYVLLPPSRTKDGPYEWVSRGRATRRSDKLLEACGRGREKHRDRDAWAIEPDMAENVSLAKAWLRGERAIGTSWCKLAVEGAGGDNTTYATAAMMKSCGLSEGTALELMWEEWNGRCDPPWEYEELALKVENGYAYNTSPPGNVTPAYHVARIAGMFRPAEARPLAEGREVTSGRFRFVDGPALAGISPPEWLLGDFLPEDAFAMLIGASGSYKTFLALDAALAIATGRESPLWGAPARPGPVLFAVGEGRAGLRRRAEAWATAHQGSAEVPPAFVLADPVPHVQEQALDPFIEGALKHHPEGYRLLVLDTASRAMQGVNENSQEVATAFTRLADELRRELGCTVLALHHTGHDHADRARGSSAFLADPDTIVVAQRSGDRVARLHMAKQKDWEPWEDARWADLEPVGDSLVVKRREAPAKSEQAPQGMRDDPRSQVPLALVDQFTVDALQRYHGRKLNTSELAGIIAAEGMIVDGEQVALGIGEEAIRKKLRTLRELGSGAKCQKMYDAGSKSWRYSPPAASDFSPVGG